MTVYLPTNYTQKSLQNVIIIPCHTFDMAQRKLQRNQDSVAFLLAQVGARSAQLFASLLAPLDFTPPDAGILRLLHLSPGISQQELAQRLNMHASRLVAVIDSMEQRGLLKRQANPQDRRFYALHLTEAGREAIAAIGRVARAHEEAVCAGLDAAERARLSQLLQKIAAQQGLAPGVHPGYRNLGAGKPENCAP
jgi:DNA-binding MarR family transcriptional regulator